MPTTFMAVNVEAKSKERWKTRIAANLISESSIPSLESSALSILKVAGKHNVLWSCPSVNTRLSNKYTKCPNSFAYQENDITKNTIFTASTEGYQLKKLKNLSNLKMKLFFQLWIL